MVFAFKDEGGVHEWYTVDEDVSEISSVEFLNERISSIRENIAVEEEFELLLKRGQGWFLYLLNFNFWRRIDAINWNYVISINRKISVYGYVDLSAWAKQNRTLEWSEQWIIWKFIYLKK